MPSNLSAAAEDRLESEPVKRVQALSRLLDNAIAIPGIGYRIGLDPILGLLPGGGDLISGIISVYVVFEAARLGVPAATLGRMGFNIILEVLLGTVPMVGDFFDVVWKANAKNVRLLERHMISPRPRKKLDKLLAVVIVAVLLAIVLGAATLSLLFVRWVLQM